ncbi:MAG TPA: 3-isopropylmalate dehydratase small subunit [Gemmatimonadetes bacterium]|nr:3-isopropylmalate dehydratase small subunit [Gemmatimonadota bacterium]
MEPIRVHTGIVAPLDRADIDTDQIIPKQFLKRIERSGYGRFLFNDWRYTEDGSPRPDFVLNRPEYQEASILVTRRNFGCGSSREHAAWALRDAGFRAVLAPSFADIFRENADQNGIAAVVLTDDEIDLILSMAIEHAPHELTVDLESRTVAQAGGPTAVFEMDDFRRTCLLEGLDRIGLTLRYEAEISAYERARRAALR